MPQRTIAISDIHGCLAALDKILEAIDPQPEDSLITLGDYCDRGPHSREVIRRLIDLSQACRLVPLLGNHDEMMLEICHGKMALLGYWLLFGGDATVRSYGGLTPDKMPGQHVEFFESCLDFHETDRHFFVHGNYLPDRPLQGQPREVLLWESLKVRHPGPHENGKLAIVGHTSQKDGEILDLGYLKCIDTYCYGDGWLTAMEIETGQVWQANKQGRRR